MKKNNTVTSTINSRQLMPRSHASFVMLAVIAFSMLLFGTVMFTSGNVSAEETDSDTTWTCSMHPQIVLPSSGQCPLCGMDLIPVPKDDDMDVGERSIRMSQSARKLAGISTTPVERRSVSREIRMVGTVAYDETKLSYITSWVPGRLDRLYADYTGISVKKGDHLVYLYSPELMAAQEELIQAKIASAALKHSNSSLLTSAVKTVDAVREKLSLYGLSDDQIKEIENSEKASDHLTINAPVGGVVVHKNAKEGMYVETGTRIYTIADLSKLWILFDAYESDLAWLRYGQKVEFSSTAYPGDKFAGNITFIDPVLNPRTRTAKVRVIVDNSDSRLKPDMFVTGTVYAQLNADGDVIDEQLAGKWIGPMHPEIVKDGPGSCDICEMPLVRAETLPFAVGASSGGPSPLVIPASAPLITGRRAVVYVEQKSDKGNLYEGREVILGSRVGDSYIVREGLREGEAVVVNGAFKIDAELQLRAKPSMMAPSGGGSQAGHQHGQATMVSASVKDEHSDHEMDDSDKDEHSGHEMNATSAEQTKESVSLKAREALTPIYDSYFMAQAALASDSLKPAIAAFDSLSNSVRAVDMKLFTGEWHMKWMNISKQMSELSTKASSSEDIVAARATFEELSKVVIELQKTFGHAGESEHFLTYCPMAFGRGAYWLQNNDTVNNSYIGTSMLRCGSVKETFLSDGKAE